MCCENLLELRAIFLVDDDDDLWAPAGSIEIPP